VRIYRVRPDSAFAVWFSLHICPTRKAMNSHIARWAKSIGNAVVHDAATAGLVRSTSIREFPAEGKLCWYSDHFATVFLNHEDLRKHGAEIVAHEALHCALAHERFVQHYSMDYSSSTNMEHEERLCYTHGRIVIGIYRALRGRT
jgi:hypothetical protein